MYDPSTGDTNIIIYEISVTDGSLQELILAHYNKVSNSFMLEMLQYSTD